MKYLNQYSTEAEYDNHFWSNVNKTESCWLWIGCLTPKGYGEYGKRHGRGHAHRLSYIKLVGKVPKGKFVLHKCSNRNCVNPEHLYVGTISDNNRDRLLAGHYQIGEDVKSHKLTQEMVLDARRVYGTERIGVERLAKRYGVSGSTLHAAITGKTWAWLGK